MAEHGEQAALLAGELTPQGHRLLARVYYADTDFSGVVYHARYLEFLERGRSDYLRLTGLRHSELADGSQQGLQGERLVWIVRRMELEFRQPARIDDVLAIETRTEAITGARIAMRQTIRRDATLLIEARVEAAVVDGTGRPRRFPRAWTEAFMPADAGAVTPR